MTPLLRSPVRGLAPCVILSLAVSPVIGCGPDDDGVFRDPLGLLSPLDEEPAPGGHANGTLATDNDWVIDPSFEDAPSQWTLTHEQFTLDDDTAYHGERSLRIELDAGLGEESTAFSREIRQLEVGEAYVLRFYTRHKGCVDAGLGVHVGIDSVSLTFQGDSDEWTAQALYFVADDEYSTSIDINTHRWGSSDDYQRPEHDNNFMWIDGFTVEPAE